jgi:TonB-dependent SusC/RagA subfamily outer membrane receptor
MLKWVFKGKLFFLFALLFLFHQAQGQSITFSGKGVTLRKAFEAVKKQTGYTVFYNAEQLKTAVPIDIDVKAMPLEDFLKTILDKQSLSYDIKSTNIVVYPAKEKSAGATVTVNLQPAPVDDSLVYGNCADSAAHKPLVGVTITNMTRGGQRKISTLSGPDGNFVIKAVKGDRLQFTSVGYAKTNVKYNGNGGAFLNIMLKVEAVELKGISVTYEDPALKKKIPWTDTIDLTHRHYENLGQVLQGTIPGLTLQSSSSSQQTFQSVVGLELYNGRYTQTISDLQNQYNTYIAASSPQYGSFQSWLNSFWLPIVNSIDPSAIHYATTVTNNGLVPELRGVSGFNGNTSGMLVEIDGVPQSGFNANYPMTNVESIKVIKDPEELAKYGPGGAGGVILITTKQGVAGRLRIQYQANFYYSHATRFNRNRLRLASTADVLDYLKSAYDSGFVTYSISPGSYLFNGTPADQLLWGLNSGALSQNTFNQKWDSLGGLDNQGQLNLLQQNIFNQNHTLTLSGGNKNWTFMAAGSYAEGSTTNALGSTNHQVGLNMRNSFRFFKNKLVADWLLNIVSQNANQGHLLDPTNSIFQEPYQLLLDQKGGYLYDYSQFSPDANAVMMAAGYKNYGVNVLQDNRLNKTITKNLQTISSLNLNWNVSPCLKWSNSFQITLLNSNTENYQDAQSSEARQMVDDYTSPSFDTNGNLILNAAGKPSLTYYVPEGGMLTRMYSQTGAWVLRSALVFNKQFDKHDISISIGGNSSKSTANSPAYSTLYGYDPSTGKGQPILLPSQNPQGLITNYYSLPGIYASNAPAPAITPSNAPSTLLTPFAAANTDTRILGWNGGLKYVFDNAFIVKGSYNAIFSPNYGYNPPYTSQSNYQAEAGWRLSNQHFFHPPQWVNDLYFSAGVNGFELPNLPTQISATRSLQTDWSNFGIWVNSYNTSQQNGQNIYTVYEKISLGLFEKALVLDISYNTLHPGYGTNGKDSSDTRYLGVGGKLKLRKETLLFAGTYGRSPEGLPQTNLYADYKINQESYFHSKIISRLELNFTQKNISPDQAMESITGTNVVQPDGSFSQVTVSAPGYGLLPPQVVNKEGDATVGFLGDRYLFDIRYYQTTTSGLNNNIPVPTDPATGLSSQISYSRIAKKGVEVFLVMRVVEKKNFYYTISLNGAYNKNLAEQVPTQNFSQSASYLTAYRNGYSTDNLWSYRWAGLDNRGNPQIYDVKRQKTISPDSTSLGSALVYSGVTRAPYTGGFIQEWGFKGFFARATFLLNMGHVMREYIPSPTSVLDNSILIRDRWRQPGDELHTDVPAMTNTTAASTRTFITQNSTNSILPADNIRLQEVQVGWQMPKNMAHNLSVKSLMLSFQVQNAALWVRNKLHVDPQTVSTGGQIGITTIPRQYSFTIAAEF